MCVRVLVRQREKCAEFPLIKDSQRSVRMPRRSSFLLKTDLCCHSLSSLLFCQIRMTNLAT